MEVHRQTCQNCGSRSLKNHLVRETGQQDVVVVQCSNCLEFVARYILAPVGYYHNKKGFESYIRSLSRLGQSMSGKKMQAEFANIQQECGALFDRVINYLKEHHKDD